MKKVITSFTKYRESDSLTLSEAVAKSMDGNVYFPSPEPSIEDYKAEVAALAQAIINAKYGGRNAIAIKNTLLASVNGMTTNLAMYVNTVSKGNVDMLTTTALPLVKDRAPIYLVAPAIKQLLQGLDAGSILAKVGAVKGAKSYIFMCAVDNGDGKLEWQSFPFTKTKFEFTGLEEGKKYWFRVIAVGSRDQSVSSADVAIFVMQRNISKAA